MTGTVTSQDRPRNRSTISPRMQNVLKVLSEVNSSVAHDLEDEDDERRDKLVQVVEERNRMMGLEMCSWVI